MNTQDVTAAARAERITRIYATLSSVNEAIVRVRKRLPLFREVCRVLVETGRLRMVWVGEVGTDGSIVPVAHSGVTDGYLGAIRISALDVPEGRGPTGIAVRERHHVSTAEIANDPRMAPWRDAALARGYRSSAAFPLLTNDHCAAVVTAYASERGFFDHEEVELFDRMAADLSFALEAMQHEERRRTVEAQYRASEEQFRVAAQSMLDSLTIVSPVRDAGNEIIDFRHAYVNDAYCSLTGFDRDQLLDRRLGDVFPEFPGSHLFEVYRRVAATGEPCRIDDLRGEQVWTSTPLATRVLDVVIASMVDDRLVVSARDVTHRKQSERELRLRAELLDLAHDAVIVRDPATSRVTFWNREAESIYGYTRNEAVGSVTHEMLATVYPGFGASVDEALAQDGQWVGELLHTRKDGEVIVVASRQALQRDQDGRPIAIIELNSDISERKRAEEELADATALLERTQEISKTGGWEYDADTGKITCTDETYRIYGVEPTSEPIDIPRALAAYAPESAPVLVAAFERLLAEREPYDLELDLVRADGRRIRVRTIGRPDVKDGRLVGVYGHIADVSDRWRIEEQLRTLNAELEQRVVARTRDLERANGELETFAYSVSHDLRAPLRAVDGFSKALLEDYGEKLDEEGRHYLERVRVGAVRMGKLIDEILQLSRLSRRPFELERVDISALAREVVDELTDAEPERRVRTDIEDGLVAQADIELVRVVLQNLLANAFKFTSKAPEPRIRCGAVKQDGVAVYFVADNGAGFDMAHAHGRLFRPFHRLHRESEFPGDGIGLATVVRAAQRHGGLVWAEGAVNQGATFYFSLGPGAQPPASAATGEDTIPMWQPAHEEAGDGR